MTSIALTPAERYTRWLNRLRIAGIAIVIWIGLAFLAGQTMFGGGPQRPAVLIGAGHSILVLIGIVGLSLAGAALAALRGRVDGVRPLATVALGWALWATVGGTMDTWLIDRNPVPGPPAGGPYWALLPDYVVLALLVVGVLLLNGFLASRGAAGSRRVAGTLFPLEASAAERRNGPLALLITIAAAGVLVHILMGPPLGHTLRAQVYFAVGAGFWLAVYVARQVTKVERAGWFWPAPLIVGAIGMILAAMRPGHAPPYDQLNIIPAWNLARPLPIEMVGVGLLAIMAHFRSGLAPVARSES